MKSTKNIRGIIILLRSQNHQMKFYKLLLEYRLYLGFILLIAAIGFAFVPDWVSFTVLLIGGLVAIGSHFFFGPLRLVQDAMQSGDIEGAKKYLAMVKYPNLLFKPVRQGYYMIQSNLSMMNKDYAGAEAHLKESLKNKTDYIGKEYEGASYLQLGMLAAQKGDTKEAKANLRTALQKGLPDNDSKATAFLQLASIEISLKQFKPGKDYFRKAKALNPKAKELKQQIAEMEKYVARIPG
jgi:tetratricopeptide (TPR) repeat protein